MMLKSLGALLLAFFISGCATIPQDQHYWAWSPEQGELKIGEAGLKAPAPPGYGGRKAEGGQTAYIKLGPDGQPLGAAWLEEVKAGPDLAALRRESEKELTDALGAGERKGKAYEFFDESSRAYSCLYSEAGDIGGGQPSDFFGIMTTQMVQGLPVRSVMTVFGGEPAWNKKELKELRREARDWRDAIWRANPQNEQAAD